MKCALLHDNHKTTSLYVCCCGGPSIYSKSWQMVKNSIMHLKFSLQTCRKWRRRRRRKSSPNIMKHLHWRWGPRCLNMLLKWIHVDIHSNGMDLKTISKINVAELLLVKSDSIDVKNCKECSTLYTAAFAWLARSTFQHFASLSELCHCSCWSTNLTWSRSRSVCHSLVPPGPGSN